MFNKSIYMGSLLMLLWIKSYSHPVIDSFINANICFVKYGLSLKEVSNCRLNFKDFKLDSAKIENRYKSYVWKDVYKIFEVQNSTRNEDIVDLKNLPKTNCEESDPSLDRNSQVLQINAYRMPSYTEGSYNYYLYVFNYGNSYMNVIFKLVGNKIVRLCYTLANS